VQASRLEGLGLDAAAQHPALAPFDDLQKRCSAELGDFICRKLHLSVAKMSAVLDEEYERLKKFMGLFYEWFEAKPQHPSEIHPVAVLEVLEKKSRAQAKRGLEMAINDCVEVSSSWSPELVESADKRFFEQDSPSLSQVRAKYSRKCLQVLKRGKIASMTEYYLVKGILDGGGIEPGAGEDETLASMLADYERRAASDSKS
jgi:hypothetical protein